MPSEPLIEEISESLTEPLFIGQTQPPQVPTELAGQHSRHDQTIENHRMNVAMEAHCPNLPMPKFVSKAGQGEEHFRIWIR